jgi:hypothetical protein
MVFHLGSNCLPLDQAGNGVQLVRIEIGTSSLPDSSSLEPPV